MNKYEYKNQLETLQELAHIGLWEFDLTTKTLTWSNEIYNIFEMDNKTFIPTYEDFFKIVHPEDKELLENAYLNSLKTKERFKISHRLLMNDGRVKYVEESGNTLFDEKGNPLISRGTIQDITELSLAKIEAQNEHNKLKAILENIPDLLWIKDVNGVYITCNKRFEDFFGAKEKDIINKTDYDFVDKKLADFFKEHDIKAMNSKKPLSNFEDITFASDGHKEYLQSIKSKVIDSNGNIIGVLDIGRDLTELRDKEVKLTEQQEELQSIYNTTKDGLAIVDMKTNFVKVNKAYCEITGLSEEELLGTSCLALSDPQDRERVSAIMNEFMQKGVIDNFEKVCIIKNKRINVTLSASWMPDKKHILLSMKDITKNKLFEEQSKLAAMGEMIGNIAHQWRQPLSAITTSITGLKLKKEYDIMENDDIEKTADDIIKSANFLSKTIDDFRNFFKKDKIIEDFYIDEVIQNTYNIIKASYQNNLVEIDFEMEHIGYRGYPTELSQVVLNILSNAKEALVARNKDDRYVHIKLKTSPDCIQISIHDNAGGVDEEIMEKIFDPYFTTKHKSMGTGLGLYMSTQIVKGSFKGNLYIQNEDIVYNGKSFRGANFIVELPIQQKDDDSNEQNI